MDWKTSESRPGYQEQHLRQGPVTITVYRPILSPQEHEAREKATAAALSPIMANYYRQVANRKEITP